jgi:hypothetical protein
MSLRDAHVWWAWVVVVSNAAVGLWALGAHRWEGLRHKALWWATAAAEVAIALEVVLGVVLLNREDRKPPQFHMFYGFVALATVGIIYSYRQQLASRRYLLYGFGGLFLMGLALRAMVVGVNR